jgi:two-component system sensor histidine kinase PhoQ
MKSIKSRLTLVSMIVLIAFMILTAIVLERAVEQRALVAEKARLQLLIYGLLAGVDRNRAGFSITISADRLFENRLVTRNSGLYAILYNAKREQIWRSRSTIQEFPDIEKITPGDWLFKTLEYDSKPYFILAFALQWPDVKEMLQRYDVVVWQDATSYIEQIERFKQTLWIWLVVTIALLLIVMYVVTMWSLGPLKKVGLEIKAIEDRQQTGFERKYPAEITPLTDNLNVLLSREQYQQQRYRNAMDDLAHSLKTPLAVLSGLSDTNNTRQLDLVILREQVNRMNQIVSYQLQKASSAAEAKISKPIDLVQIVGRITSALEKVYHEKSVQLETDMASAIMLRMDESDCLEVFGNLLDNAFKYSCGHVSVSSSEIKEGQMQVAIEDDGRGLAEQEIEQILNRGTRLDQSSEGQGIGLAVVADIVKSYNIGMTFKPSRLGGLSVNLVFKTV